MLFALVHYKMKFYLLIWALIAGASFIVFFARGVQQRNIVKWINENGGSVTYMFNLDENGVYIEDSPEPLFARLGFTDLVSDVTSVDLSGTDVRNIKPLAKLYRLDSLFLDFTDISDLSPLSRLRHLEVVSAEGTNVKNIEPLGNCQLIMYRFLRAYGDAPLAQSFGSYQSRCILGEFGSC